MASEKVKEITDKDFNDSVKQGVSLIDFWATWCGPCQMQGPIVDGVAEKMDGKAMIAKVNVDDAQSVAAQFGVQSIPTIIIFKDGNEVKRMVGLQEESVLLEALEEVIA